MDDHGNRVPIKNSYDRTELEELQKRLEAAGHKQTYFITVEGEHEDQ